MSTQTTQFTYEVVLWSDVAAALGVESPVETEHIDYYDAGLWVTTAVGRDFYPYDHVLTIRERPTTAEPAEETGPSEAVPAEARGETQD